MPSRLLLLVVLIAFGAGFAACKPTSKCSAASCNGCCSDQGACVAGTTASQCGRAGNLCKACGLDESCVPTTGTCLAGMGGGASGTGGGTSGTGGGSVGGGSVGGGTAGGQGGGTIDPSMVEGTCLESWTADADAGVRPCPFGASPPTGMIPLEDGGYQSVTASVRSDGTFTISNVPTGPYFVRVGTAWYRTTARRFSMSYESIGRVDRSPAGTGTSLSINTTGLAMWDSLNHFVNLYSSNLGLAMEQLVSNVEPLDGDTAFTFQVPYDLYSQQLGTPMIDSTKGDQLLMTQAVFEASGEVKVVGAGAPMGVTMVSGQANATSVMLSSVQAAQTPLDVDVAAFSAHATDLTGSMPAIGVQFTAGPRSSFVRTSDGLAFLYGFFPPPGTTTLPTSPISYPNPFPSTWSASALIQLSTINQRLAPTAFTAKNYFSAISTTVPLTALTSQVTPQVSPPKNVQINGMPFSTDLSAATRTPTITWSAPTLGPPSRYLLRVEQLQVSSSRTTSRVTVVFWLLPTDTSFTVPPNLLTVGQGYVLTLTAFKTSSDLTRDFLAFTLPLGSGSVVSGVVRP